MLFTSAVALVLALSGSFAKLAAVSAVARLVTYTGACAATLMLRHRADPSVRPATFVVPLGPVVPVLAILVSAAILAGASREQLVGGVVALLVGAVLFVANSPRGSGR